MDHAGPSFLILPGPKWKFLYENKLFYNILSKIYEFMKSDKYQYYLLQYYIFNSSLPKSTKNNLQQRIQVKKEIYNKGEIVKIVPQLSLKAQFRPWTLKTSTLVPELC